MAKIDKVIYFARRLSFASFFLHSKPLNPADWTPVSVCVCVAWSGGVNKFPPGWDTGPLQGYSWHPVIHQGGEKTAESVSLTLEHRVMQAVKPKR